MIAADRMSTSAESPGQWENTETEIDNMARLLLKAFNDKGWR